MNMSYVLFMSLGAWHASFDAQGLPAALLVLLPPQRFVPPRACKHTMYAHMPQM